MLIEAIGNLGLKLLSAVMAVLDVLPDMPSARTVPTPGIEVKGTSWI